MTTHLIEVVLRSDGLQNQITLVTNVIYECEEAVKLLTETQGHRKCIFVSVFLGVIVDTASFCVL